MQAPSLCSDVTIPVWVLRGVSVSFWEEGFVRGIFGWTWLFTAFGLQWPMGGFSKPTQGRYACSDVLTPLAGSFVFSFQHALLPSCIQSFYKSSPKPTCVLSNLFPIWGYVYQLRKDFWPRSLPKPSQTLCHTYYSHCSRSHQACSTLKHCVLLDLPFLVPCL